MATLTSTGAVNLTSTTNWSPAQIPAPGDDLIIGAHTLTLDADLILSTVTFSNAASRMAFSGSTRTVEATNGWFVTATISAQLLTTTITSGNALTFIGKWTIAASLTSIVAMTGGTLSFSTVAGVASDILFQIETGVTFSISPTAITGGNLNTTGRFISLSGSFVGFGTYTGLNWNHTSLGVNQFNTAVQVFTLQGTSSLTWYGDVLLTSTSTVRFLDFVACSGTTNVYGDIKQSSTGRLLSLGSSNTCTLNIFGEIICGDNPDSILIASGTMNWQNQSAEIPSNGTFIVSVNGGTLSLSGLVLTNFGKVLVTRNSGSLIASDSTQILNQLPTAQFLARGSTVLDSRVLYLNQAIPTLPSPEDVAASVSYGYSGFEQVGTGLIVDPVIISSAVLAAQLAALQKNPSCVLERTTEDTKPLTFSWPNNTDTVQGQVSIDNGDFNPVSGVITYLRNENGKYYYTLSYNSNDRPNEEGTARYRFYSGTYSAYTTLRTLKASPVLGEIKNGLALESTSQDILTGVTSLNSNDRSEFF